MMEICLLLLLKLQSNLGYRDSLGLSLIAWIIESLDKKNMNIDVCRQWDQRNKSA